MIQGFFTSDKSKAFLPHPYIGLLGIGAIFFVLAGCRWSLWTYGTDTGLFAQAILNASAGFVDGPEGGSHFCFHWSPILAVFTPLMLIFRAPLILQFGQIALIFSTTIPLYHLAKRYTSETTARFFAYATMLYAPLLGVGFQEFHELAFLPLLMVSMIEALDRQAWRSFSVYAFLALLVREDALFVTTMLGLVLIAVGQGWLRPTLGGRMCGRRSTTIAGTALSAASLLTFWVYFSLVIKVVGPWQPSQNYHFPFADGPLSLILALIRHPDHLTAVMTAGRFSYLLEALLPGLFLAVYSVWALVALPGFSVVLLSSESHVWRMGEHYAALWMPAILLASIDGFLRITKKFAEPWMQQRLCRAIAVILGLNLIIDNHLHFGYYLRPLVSHHELLMRVLAEVPHDAYLLVNDQWFPHIAMTYPYASTGPTVAYDWAIVDSSDPNNAVLTPLLQCEYRAKRFVLVDRQATISVYHQIAPHNLTCSAQNG